MNMTTKFCFFCNQKTAYEMRISDWSSDVCSSDLVIDAYRSPGTAPNVEHLFPSPPATAMARWASDRLEAVGTTGSEIGRASCRERVCQYVSISVVAVSLKQKRAEARLGSATQRSIP